MRGPVHEFLRECGNAALLSNPLKADEMASALSTLAGNEAIRRQKIDAGLRNAQRFSWRSTAENILSLYEAVYAQERTREKHSGFLNKHALATRD